MPDIINKQWLRNAIMKINNKSQVFSETFKYIFAGVFSVIILMAGYNFIGSIQQQRCAAEIKNFEYELKNMDKSIRYGTKELKSYLAPCNAKNIYLFDLSKKIDFEQFSKIPIMQDSLKTSGNHNIFLIGNSRVIGSFYSGNLDIGAPFYFCLLAQNGKIGFFAEGTANAAKITLPDEQLQCA